MTLAAAKLAFPADHDVVVPLFQLQWSTRAVLEGLASRYGPRALHVVAPRAAATAVERAAEQEGWDTPGLTLRAEDDFFVERFSLTKNDLAALLDLPRSLYPAGWFYQQILKLGAREGIAGLSEAYLVWDSDLLPVDGWPAVHHDCRLAYALLQDSSRGNAEILARWEQWIRKVLNVPPAVAFDGKGTLISHHMWFEGPRLDALWERLASYYKDDETPWPALMMRSANDFGTFSEFWLYASWVAAADDAKAPEPFAYAEYGSTTERFFEDGSAPFAAAARRFLKTDPGAPFRPGYTELIGFIEDAYQKLGRPLPSSLSFEASERHRLKGRENMHVEELRSPWHTAAD